MKVVDPEITRMTDGMKGVDPVGRVVAGGDDTVFSVLGVEALSNDDCDAELGR